MGARHVLEIRRRFSASPEEVFEAFRDPELLRDWAAPREHRTESVEQEFRVGGRYRRELRFPDGSVHVLAGEFREIEVNRRLVYTYRWETLPVPDTLVEIDFRPTEDGGTELRLVHSGFESADTAAEHEGGWAQCFDQLAATLSPAGGAR